jgi:hypothetical protein
VTEKKKKANVVGNVTRGFGLGISLGDVVEDGRIILKWI